MVLAKHDLLGIFFRPGWVGKLLLQLFSISLLAFPVIRNGGWPYGLAFTCVWILVALWKAHREISPRNMQLVEKNYLERKLRLFRLINYLSVRETLSEQDVKRFQEEALQLIVGYVRDHRADRRATEIFANLVIEKDGWMHVIARDQPHRQTSEALRREHSLAWLAMQTARPHLTGDVYADYPETMPGKPYLSILTIPVVTQERVLGAVSIDSSRRYHFDRSYKDLVNYLMPYVALLAWTLDPRNAKK